MLARVRSATVVGLEASTGGSRRRGARAGCGIAGPTNASIPLPRLHERRWLSDEVRPFLRQAIDRLCLSPRAYERVIRVARTIADLDAAAEVRIPPVAEALQYRCSTAARERWGPRADDVAASVPCGTRSSGIARRRRIGEGILSTREIWRRASIPSRMVRAGGAPSVCGLGGAPASDAGADGYP